MEERFRGVWRDMERRRDRGERLDRVLKQASDAELVAALAGAADRDPVAANAIATELLNRTRRAPYLGAFLVSSTVVVAIYVLDFVYTGTPLFLDAGPRTWILLFLSVAIAVVSLLTYLMWRGRFRGIRAALERRRSY